MIPSIKARLEEFSDKQLENELQRRHRQRAKDMNQRRSAEVGEPSVETYMALRYPDQNLPFAEKYRVWFNDTYLFDKRGFRKLGLFSGSGFNVETGQQSLTVAMFKDKHYTLQLAAEEFLPHMLEVTLETDKGKVTGKFFEVMERTGAESGAYWIGVYKNEAILYRTAYGRTEVVFTAGTLRQVLKYVWNHHWYE